MQSRSRRAIRHVRHGSYRIRISSTDVQVLADYLPARRLGGLGVLIRDLLWPLLLLLLSAYLLTSAITDTPDTAEIRILVGGTLFATAFFWSLFVAKRHLMMRKMERHAKGKSL